MTDDTDALFNYIEEQRSDQEKIKNALISQIQEAAALWPEFLAMFKGMVNQAMEDGWEELAARALVLSSITGGMNSNIIANIPSTDDNDG